MSFHSTSFQYSVSVKAAGWGWHVLLPALVFSRFSTLSHPKAVHKRRMGVSILSQWERVCGAGASDRDGREGALCRVGSRLAPRAAGRGSATRNPALE